jgi:hypothetical protein
MLKNKSECLPKDFAVDSATSELVVRGKTIRVFRLAWTIINVWFRHQLFFFFSQTCPGDDGQWDQCVLALPGLKSIFLFNIPSVKRKESTLSPSLIFQQIMYICIRMPGSFPSSYCFRQMKTKSYEKEILKSPTEIVIYMMKGIYFIPAVYLCQHWAFQSLLSNNQLLWPRWRQGIYFYSLFKGYMLRFPFFRFPYCAKNNITQL